MDCKNHVRNATFDVSLLLFLSHDTQMLCVLLCEKPLESSGTRGKGHLFSSILRYRKAKVSIDSYSNCTEMGATFVKKDKDKKKVLGDIKKAFYAHSWSLYGNAKRSFSFFKKLQKKVSKGLLIFLICGMKAILTISCRNMTCEKNCQTFWVVRTHFLVGLIK